jgi:hypothetical protein
MLSGMNPLYAQKQRKMVHRDAIRRVRAPVVCTKAKKIVHRGCHVGLVRASVVCTKSKENSAQRVLCWAHQGICCVHKRQG